MRFIYVRQNFWVHKKAPHWVRATLTSLFVFYFSHMAFRHVKGSGMPLNTAIREAIEGLKRSP